MPRILIVGGGYAGFYTAWRLERLLRPGEPEVVVVDPRPYMTYQPPAVLSGRDIVALQAVQQPRAAFVAAGDRRAEP